MAQAAALRSRQNNKTPHDQLFMETSLGYKYLDAACGLPVHCKEYLIVSQSGAFRDTRKFYQGLLDWAPVTLFLARQGSLEELLSSVSTLLSSFSRFLSSIPNHCPGVTRSA